MAKYRGFVAGLVLYAAAMHRRLIATAIVMSFAVTAAGCTDTDAPVDQPDQWVFGGDRPVELRVPDAYNHDDATPLMIVLHGYSAAGLIELVYARLDTVVNNHNVLVAAPDGTIDQDDNRFWNLTDTGVDDVAYINGLITEISGVWNVDPKRIFLFGHSNGAFMAYRLACENSDRIAAIVGLAGASLLDETACNPSEAVSVLHLHGDQDSTILYDGDTWYPSADDSTRYWAGYNGCSATRTTSSEQIDIDNQVAGAETRVEQHDDCPPGVAVELWTMEGSEHIPTFPDVFADHVWQWMAAHAKRE